MAGMMGGFPMKPAAPVGGGAPGSAKAAKREALIRKMSGKKTKPAAGGCAR